MNQNLSKLIPPDVSPEDIDIESLPVEERKALLEGLQQSLIQKAREDVNVFTALHFGKPAIPLHREWQDKIDSHQRVLIAAMRDHGKSSQITQLRSVWELGRDVTPGIDTGYDPGIRIKFISVSKDRASKFITDVSQHIKGCRQGICQLVFPELRRDTNRSWSSYQINVVRPKDAHDTRDPSVEAWGISSSPEGGRANILIFDDITSLQTSCLEPRMREQIKEVFKGTWLDIKSGPNTRYWYLCTLWHNQDASAEVMKTPGWNSYVYRISDDFERIETNYDETLPLWSDRWNKKALIDEYKTRGAFYFNRSFRNNPVSKEDRLFSQEMFFGSDDSPGAVSYGIPPWHEMFAAFPKYTGVDLGIQQKDKNKPSVIFTIAVSDGSGDIPKGTRIPVDIRTGKWNSPDTARMLIEVYNDLRPEVIKVENNYYQQALIDWINDLQGISLPIEPHFTGSQKMHPEYGIPLLASEFERDLWKIPFKYKHPDDCSCPHCKWIREMINYAPGAESTDLVMACWFAQRAAREMEQFSGGFGVFSL